MAATQTPDDHFSEISRIIKILQSTLASTMENELAPAPIREVIEANSADPISVIFAQHQATMRAGLKLTEIFHDDDLRARLKAHMEYREAARTQINLLTLHNRTGPSVPWNIEIVVDPLVRFMFIEADLEETIGNPSRSCVLREEAMELAHCHLKPAVIAAIRRSEASRLALEGRFNEALTLLSDLRQEFTMLGDVVQIAQTALDEAVILEWLGDHERALQALRYAEERVSSLTPQYFTGQSPLELLQHTVNMQRMSLELSEREARIRKQCGELDEAERLWNNVFQTYNSLSPAGGAAIEYQLATIDLARGDYDKARTRLVKIEPQFESGLLRPRRAGLRLLQAQVELAISSKSQVALRHAEDGLSDLNEFPDYDLEWKLQWRRASALQSLRRKAKALEAYGAAALVIDSLRKSPLGYRLDSTYLSSKLPVFEAAVDLAVERNAGAACARFIELTKARALSSVLSVPTRQRHATFELEQEFNNVTRRLDTIEFMMYRNQGTRELGEEHRELLLHRHQLLEEIRLRDPRWRLLSEPSEFDVEALLGLLGARRQAALTLYYRPDRVVAVLLAGGEITVDSQLLDKSVKRAIDEYAENLVKWKPDVYSHDFSAEYDIPADAIVPRKLLERALSEESLIIAPHHCLHLLPWPGLLFNERRLFQYAAIGVLPNLTCLEALDGEFSPAPRATLFGNADYRDLPRLPDLPGVGLELNKLQSLYTAQRGLVAPMLTGQDASNEALLGYMAHDDVEDAILHISCHGSFNITEPMAAGLLLKNGKVDAGEISLMRLKYREVVLSACSTGWRPQSVGTINLTGDDVLGLPGAFLEAGARAVLVSIPKANDSATRDFMILYHQRRLAGVTPLQAFRHTQLDMLTSNAFPAYSWVGFVCYAVR